MIAFSGIFPRLSGWGIYKLYMKKYTKKDLFSPKDYLFSTEMIFLRKWVYFRAPMCYYDENQKRIKNERGSRL